MVEQSGSGKAASLPWMPVTRKASLAAGRVEVTFAGSIEDRWAVSAGWEFVASLATGQGGSAP
jgi:hypothetical protein